MITNILGLCQKILIGVAWLDGKIQPEERRHLHQVAKEKEATILRFMPLLHEFEPVNEGMLSVAAITKDRPTSELPNVNRVD
jgi:hypothetical protein